MRKRRKVLLILSALAVAAGGYLCVSSPGAKEAVSEQSGSFDLTNRTVDDLTGISWTADGETRSFTLKDGVWESEGSPSWKVNQEVLQGMAEELVNLQATRKIENVTDVTDRGLEKPEITVTAEWKNGSTVYCMGESTPFEDGYYLTVSGQADTLYTIASSLKTTFSRPQTEMAAPEEEP